MRIPNFNSLTSSFWSNLARWTNFQWQPGLTAHDPDPPLHLEDAPRLGTGVVTLMLVLAGVGTTLPSGSGSGGLTLGATGDGASVHYGSGATALTLAAQGDGRTARSGSGSSALTLALEGTGARVSQGAGDGAASLDVSGVGWAPAYGSGTPAFTTGVSGTGQAPNGGTGAPALTIEATGVGQRATRGSGTVALALSTIGVGETPVVVLPEGSGVSTLPLSVEGLGWRESRGTGTSALSLRVVGKGRAPGVEPLLPPPSFGGGFVLQERPRTTRRPVPVAKGWGVSTLTLSAQGDGGKLAGGTAACAVSLGVFGSASAPFRPSPIRSAVTAQPSGPHDVIETAWIELQREMEEEDELVLLGVFDR